MCKRLVPRTHLVEVGDGGCARDRLGNRFSFIRWVGPKHTGRDTLTPLALESQPAANPAWEPMLANPVPIRSGHWNCPPTHSPFGKQNPWHKWSGREEARNALLWLASGCGFTAVPCQHPLPQPEPQSAFRSSLPSRQRVWVATVLSSFPLMGPQWRKTS